MSVLLIISIIWFVSEIVLSRMLRATDSETNQDKSSLKIIWITIFVSIFLGFYLRNLENPILQSYSNEIYSFGIILICLGLLIRWVAILTLKKSFKVHVTVQDDQKIVQAGIYQFVRHPSYSGSLLSFFGLAMIFNNWFTLGVVFIPIILAFLYRINVEEKVLAEAFGEQYSDYIKRTKKLVPFIY